MMWSNGLRLRNSILCVVAAIMAVTICGCQRQKKSDDTAVYIDLPVVMSLYDQAPPPVVGIRSGKVMSSRVISFKKPLISAHSLGALTPVDDNTTIGYEAQMRLDRLVTRLRKLEESGLADEKSRLLRLADEEHGPEIDRLLTQYRSRLLDIIMRHRMGLNQLSVDEAAYARATRDRIEWIETLRPLHRESEDELMAALALYEYDAMQQSASTRGDLAMLSSNLDRQVAQEMERLQKVSEGRIQSQSNYALASQTDNPWNSEKEPATFPSSQVTLPMVAVKHRTHSIPKVDMQADMQRVVLYSVQQLAKRQGWQVAWAPDGKRKDVTQQVIRMLQGGWQ